MTLHIGTDLFFKIVNSNLKGIHIQEESIMENNV